jgi:hypothetical protein
MKNVNLNPQDYIGTILYIPYGYKRTVTSKLNRRYPNSEKMYTKNKIVKVHEVNSEFIKCDVEVYYCDISVPSLMSNIIITQKQIGTFMRNEEKATLAWFNYENSED